MKNFANIVRVLIYSVVTFYLIYFEFFALRQFCFWVLNRLDDIRSSMNGFLFWILFMAIGISIIRILYFVLLNISKMLISITARISPYYKYPIWFSGIIAFLQLVLLAVDIFSTVETFGTGFICTIIVFMGLMLVFIIVTSTKDEQLFHKIVKEHGLTKEEAKIIRAEIKANRRYGS